MNSIVKMKCEENMEFNQRAYCAAWRHWPPICDLLDGILANHLMGRSTELGSPGK
jgi:hypothetical protein